MINRILYLVISRDSAGYHAAVTLTAKEAIGLTQYKRSRGMAAKAWELTSWLPAIRFGRRIY